MAFHSFLSPMILLSRLFMTVSFTRWMAYAGSGELAAVGAHRERVGDEEEPDAPGQGDPAVAADRLLLEDAADGVDDRGDRLVLGEPLDGAGHALGRHEGRADEGQEDQWVGEPADAVDGLGREARDHREPREGEGEQQHDADDGEPGEDAGARAEAHGQGDEDDEHERGQVGHDRRQHVPPEEGRAGDRHRLEALEDAAGDVHEEQEHGDRRDGRGDDGVRAAQDVAQGPLEQDVGVVEDVGGHCWAPWWAASSWPTIARKMSSRDGCFSTYSTLAGGSSCLSSARVPSAMMRPWWSTAIRSARCSASSRYCVVSRTVVPRPASSCTVFHTSMRDCGSSPVVGSSRKSTGGSPMRLIAMSRRRRMPPEYVDTRRRPASTSSNRSSS